jgi:Flp pilus assembly protein TadG
MNNRGKTNRRRRSGGAAALEAAAALPIVLALAAGFIEYGWLVRNSHLLQNSARQGARAAVFHENSNLEVKEAVVASLSQSIDVEPEDVTVRIAKLSQSGYEQYTVQSLDENENGEPIRVIVTVQYSHFNSPLGLFVKGDSNVIANAVMKRYNTMQ